MELNRLFIPLTRAEVGETGARDRRVHGVLLGGVVLFL